MIHFFAEVGELPLERAFLGAWHAGRAYGNVRRTLRIASIVRGREPVLADLAEIDLDARSFRGCGWIVGHAILHALQHHGIARKVEGKLMVGRPGARLIHSREHNGA